MPPIEDFLDSLRVERGASTHTIDAYRNDLTQAVAFFGKHGLGGWERLDAKQLIRYESTLGRVLRRNKNPSYDSLQAPRLNGRDREALNLAEPK